jgi:hypothetical protein
VPPWSINELSVTTYASPPVETKITPEPEAGPWAAFTWIPTTAGATLSSTLVQLTAPPA